MLVLSRKVSERILIGDEIVVTVVRIGPNSVRLAFTAPKHIVIRRQEVQDAIEKESSQLRGPDGQ